ncbi:MAG TPA: VOC family protein [Gemmatimonadaceae bacterium]
MTAASTRPLLPKIGQIAINVTDLARAVAFYRDTLGMRFLFEAPPSLAFFDCGGVRLMLSPRELDGPATGTSIIYYVVDDIMAVHALLTQRGVAFEEPPHVTARMPDHDLWMTVCKDSEGNYVGVMSEVRR